MTTVPNDRDNYCYRHPHRQSFILCQRCGRTVCAACQTQASVGVHCPDCVKEAHQRAPRAVRAARSYRSRSGTPIVTYSIIAVCVVVYGLQFVLGSALTSHLVYYAPLTFVQPWTIVTSLFAHGSVMHLLFNMFSLFILGSMLERALGRARLLALYLISGIAGVVAVAWLAPGIAVLGASGAIFGLFGALFVMMRKIGANTTQLLVILGLNLVLGFVVPGIAWQAHVGGAIVGAGIAAVMVRTTGAAKGTQQALLVAAIFVGVLVIGLARFYV